MELRGFPYSGAASHSMSTSLADPPVNDLNVHLEMDKTVSP